MKLSTSIKGCLLVALLASTAAAADPPRKNSFGIKPEWVAYCRNITDRGLHGGLLQKMTHVKRLNLRGLKQVTDAALNDLEQFRHLEHIGLRETSVSVQGIARLKEMLSQTEVFK